MLVHLSIRNFVLVDNVSLEFNEGLSVITGESGAGKSIMINALGLVLGERGSPNLVKEGADKAEISAVFDISKLEVAKNWLRTRDLFAGEECILRRIIAAGSSSRAFINGTPVTLDDIKKIGGLVVCMHGQHAQQNLLDKKNHASFIDDYGKLQESVQKYKQAYSKLLTMRQELAALRELGKSDTRTIDLLKHEMEELEKISLTLTDYKILEEEHSRLSNAGDLTDTLQNCLEIVEGKDAYDSEVKASNPGVLDNVARLGVLLSNAKDKKLTSLTEQTNQVELMLKEILNELNNYKGLLEMDPKRLEEVNGVMSELYRLARKHNVMPEQLPELQTKRKEEWDNISQLDSKIAIKEKEWQENYNSCRKLAAELTLRRKEVVKNFNQGITTEMSQLHMSCRFATKFSYKDSIGSSGDSDIEFLLSTTPTGKLLPLKDVASGGELSRAALAISKVVAKHSAVPCLIFDEADSGIGGKIAARVGQSLSELGKDAQIISITHQPQTAVYADNHYAVAKSQQGTTTLSRIKILNGDERHTEIARMLSGEKMEQDALDYASKMMDQARLNVRSA